MILPPEAGPLLAAFAPHFTQPTFDRFATLAVIYARLLSSDKLKALIPDFTPGATLTAAPLTTGNGFQRKTLPLLAVRTRSTDPALARRINAEAITTIKNYVRGHQDASHVRGIWRETSPKDYDAGGAPAWKTVLDLDKVAAAEHANWVWEGASCEPKRQQRCLLSLSDGGEDATTLREFDLKTGAFVKGGFVLPKAKQSAGCLRGEAWLVRLKDAAEDGEVVGVEVGPLHVVPCRGGFRREENPQ